MNPPQEETLSSHSSPIFPDFRGEVALARDRGPVSRQIHLRSRR
jgi:hypothetical protein